MENKETYSVLIVGVGGQGTIVSSAILVNLAMEMGHDVKSSELHGLARRGGAVNSHIRFGKKVASPLIPLAGADLLVAFEELEAIRWAGYLKPDGKLVVNNSKVMPVLATSGMVVYPQDPIGMMKTSGLEPIVIDGTSVANEMGKALYLNIAMLGYISNFFDFSLVDWENKVKERVPKFKEDNWQAFLKGRDLSPMSN